jgi:hypothetical protein
MSASIKNELSPRCLNAASDRHTLSAIQSVGEDLYTAVDASGNLGGSIVGSVVDEDDLVWRSFGKFPIEEIK